MTWQVHTERVKAKLAREITVQLKRGKKDNRARLVVYLCKAIMEKLKWKAKEPIGFLIGEDEDNSKIRVIRIEEQDNAPPQVTFVSRALKGSARCDFGFIEKFGSEAKPTCDAALRAIHVKARKDMADIYRKIRRDGKGPLARLMWQMYRDCEKKIINNILYGTPVE